MERKKEFGDKPPNVWYVMIARSVKLVATDDISEYGVWPKNMSINWIVLDRTNAHLSIKES
jgi:hypothetical protein